MHLPWQQIVHYPTSSSSSWMPPMPPHPHRGHSHPHCRTGDSRSLRHRASDCPSSQQSTQGHRAASPSFQAPSHNPTSSISDWTLARLQHVLRERLIPFRPTDNKARLFLLLTTATLAPAFAHSRHTNDLTTQPAAADQPPLPAPAEGQVVSPPAPLPSTSHLTQHFSSFFVFYAPTDCAIVPRTCIPPSQHPFFPSFNLTNLTPAATSSNPAQRTTAHNAFANAATAH